jgi:hypothetical protein
MALAEYQVAGGRLFSKTDRTAIISRMSVMFRDRSARWHLNGDQDCAELVPSAF